MLVQDQILDADEVAKLLKLNERTIKRLAARGELQGFLAAGKWRFRREAVDNYINKQEQQVKKIEKPDQ